MRQNIAYLIEQRRTNANALAVAAGVPQPTVHRILSGESLDPRTSTLKKLADQLGVTVNDLRERDLAREAQQLLPNSNVLARVGGSRRVPLIRYSEATTARVAGGLVSGSSSVAHLLTDQELSDGAFAVELVDDSMSPEFRPGDRVVLDPAIRPLPGDYVLARFGVPPAPVFGRYRPRQDGSFELAPLNPDYPTLALPGDSVVATMAEHRRYRRR